MTRFKADKRHTLRQLAEALNAARLTVPIGTHWMHVKSEDIYVITGHSIRESNGEIEVLYRPYALDHGIFSNLKSFSYIGRDALEAWPFSFSRPLDDFQMFLDEYGTRRFERVEMKKMWVKVNG